MLALLFLAVVCQLQSSADEECDRFDTAQVVETFEHEEVQGHGGPAYSLMLATTIGGGALSRSVRNSLRSWHALRPRPQIVVYGDEEQLSSESVSFFKSISAQYSSTVGQRHAATGLPLLREVFSAAERDAAKSTREEHSIIVYANSDIIFTQELVQSIDLCVSSFLSSDRERTNFFLVGKRYNMNFDEDFPLGGSDEVSARLRRQVSAQREAMTPALHNNLRWAIDFFVWNVGFWSDHRPIESWPPLIMAIPAFDNWLLHQAVEVSLLSPDSHVVIDGSNFIPAVHQRHENRWRSAERLAAKKENEELAQRWHFGNLDRPTLIIASCGELGPCLRTRES